MNKKEFLMNIPYYRYMEEKRISEIHQYFSNLRYEILSKCLPNILIKENNELEYIYSEDVKNIIKEINKLEKSYLWE